MTDLDALFPNLMLHSGRKDAQTMCQSGLYVGLGAATSVPRDALDCPGGRGERLPETPQRGYLGA